jgi:hypothetical protein
VNWPALFGAVNTAALLAWGALVLLPGRPRLLPIVRYGAVGILCALYVALVVAALTVGFGEARGGRVDFTTIAGVRAIFATDGGVVAGWTHYLALDLFAGVWIAEDADRRGFGRLAQAPVLLLTFMAGPAGLLLHYLLTRVRRA